MDEGNWRGRLLTILKTARDDELIALPKLVERVSRHDGPFVVLRSKGLLQNSRSQVHLFEARTSGARVLGFQTLHDAAMRLYVKRVNWNVAPGPSFGIAHNRPPWFSTIERLIAKPIPIPWALVV